MIKFRQKEFFLQAVAGVATAASVPLMAAGMYQSSSQAEEAEKQAEEQVKAINAQTAAINNLAKKNPEAASIVSMPRNYSDIGMKNRIKLFAAPTTPGVFSKLWDTTKNIYKANPKIANQAKFGLGIGITGGIGGYVTGKIIDSDAKKSGIDLKAAANQNQSQKFYSAALTNSISTQAASEGAGKTFLGKAKSLVGGQALNAGFAALEGVGNYGAYRAEKQALKAMQTQSKSPVLSQQKQFNAPGFFLSRVGKKLGNLTSNMLGVGNTKTMEGVGAKLVKTAGDNNIQKGVGEFMMNHRKTSAAIGVGLGAGVFTGASSLGNAAVKVPTKALDSDAYNWEKYQNSKIN